MLIRNIQYKIAYYYTDITDYVSKLVLMFVYCSKKYTDVAIVILLFQKVEYFSSHCLLVFLLFGTIAVITMLLQYLFNSLYCMFTICIFTSIAYYSLYCESFIVYLFSTIIPMDIAMHLFLYKSLT